MKTVYINCDTITEVYETKQSLVWWWFKWEIKVILNEKLKKEVQKYDSSVIKPSIYFKPQLFWLDIININLEKNGNT